MLNKFNFLKQIFRPTPSIPLGRWRLKHDTLVCDSYFNNYHGEPGYPNKFKNDWIENLKDREEKKTNEYH